MPVARRRSLKRRRAMNTGMQLGDTEQRNLVTIWSINILLELGGYKKLRQYSSGFTSDIDVLIPLQLEKIEDVEMDRKQFFATLKHQKEQLQEQPSGPNKQLKQNISLLADHLGLSNTEQQILTFAVILKGSTGLKEITDLLGDLNSEGVITLLATLLDIPLQKIRTVLAGDGLMTKSGLLRLDREYQATLENKIDLLDGFEEVIQESNTTITAILKKFIALPAGTQLARPDFAHIGDQFDMTRVYLEQALSKKLSGVNILVYGPPGTGKTELARVMAQCTQSNFYEIRSDDDTGVPFDKPKRLQAFQFAQHLLARQERSLLLFDEVDSLLSGGFSFFYDDASLNLKAWINKHLENNPVPAIWIANSIRFAETAFIRRFDIVLHLNYPPRSTRLSILNNLMDGLKVRQKWMESLAENKSLSPAVIERAVRIVRTQPDTDTDTSTDTGTQATEKQLEYLMESTLTAMGISRGPLTQMQPSLNYRLDAVNPDHNLGNVINGLRQHGEARLCLYGPPGTGKTEFGRYLARELDMPLLVKRGSDLLDKYIGGTEANIAEMFQEAIYEKAVLLLDEADSFLRDRRKAHRGWEVTQVNELLTRMERYEGIFICSTNLMDDLDAASLRRFDLKIKFDFLSAAQAWLLFEEAVQDGIGGLKEQGRWKQQLAGLDALTPGDFATVLRKNRISGGQLTPQVLLDNLMLEANFKEQGKVRSIGFLAGTT